MTDPLYRDTANDASEGWTAAVKLAKTLHIIHYGPIMSWRPLPTIAGVMSQIDNMTAGLVKPTAPTCTCHPDDRPSGDCRRKYAASDCQRIDGAALVTSGEGKKLREAVATVINEMSRQMPNTTEDWRATLTEGLT